MCRPACSLDSQARVPTYPRGASTHEQMPGASERGGAGQSVESSVRVVRSSGRSFYHGRRRWREMYDRKGEREEGLGRASELRWTMMSQPNIARTKERKNEVVERKRGANCKRAERD